MYIWLISLTHLNGLNFADLVSQEIVRWGYQFSEDYKRNVYALFLSFFEIFVRFSETTSEDAITKIIRTQPHIDVKSRTFVVTNGEKKNKWYKGFN